MKDTAEILSNYQRKVALMRAQKTTHKDIQPLAMGDVLLVKALLHPTAKQTSKDMTKVLIEYLCDEGICTAEDIYTRFGWSNKPVMKRLKIFQNFGMVKRESKKYYIATPRLCELRDKYLRQICQ